MTRRPLINTVAAMLELPVNSEYVKAETAHLLDVRHHGCQYCGVHIDGDLLPPHGSRGVDAAVTCPACGGIMWRCMLCDALSMISHCPWICGVCEWEISCAADNAPCEPMGIDGAADIIVMRHGMCAQSGRVWLGDGTDDLSTDGKADVQVSAECIANMVGPSWRLLHSPLQRCIETAKAIGRFAGLVPVAVEWLTEVMSPSWSGMHHGDIDTSAWDTNAAKDDPDPWVTAGDSGEAWGDLVSRVSPWRSLHHVILVTHGDVARAICGVKPDLAQFIIARRDGDEIQIQE